MSAAKGPTPHQAEAIARMLVAGRLAYAGGFWTTPGIEWRASGNHSVPVWSAPHETVKAMRKRGWIKHERPDGIGVEDYVLTAEAPRGKP